MKPALDIIGRFTFNVDGFKVTYRYKGETTTLTLCPAAFCDLLKEAGQIEDFTLDSNGEAVILFSDNQFPPGYGFEHWCAFVRFFHVSYRMAVKLLQFKLDREEHEAFQAKIIHLLQPLQAA